MVSNPESGKHPRGAANWLHLAFARARRAHDASRRGRAVPSGSVTEVRGPRDPRAGNSVLRSGRASFGGAGNLWHVLMPLRQPDVTNNLTVQKHEGPRTLNDSGGDRAPGGRADGDVVQHRVPLQTLSPREIPPMNVPP